MGSAFGMAHGPCLLRVVELSALLVLSQKENEEKEKTMKTLNSTVEFLVCFTSVWEITQRLLFSLSKEEWLLQEKEWQRCSLCGNMRHVAQIFLVPWHKWSHVQAVAGELHTRQVSSSERYRQCYSVRDLNLWGSKFLGTDSFIAAYKKLAVELSFLGFSKEEIE